MRFFATLTLVSAVELASVFAHPGHSDLLGKRDLYEWQKRQAALESCSGSLAARHEPRMERLHARRAEILGRQGGPGGGGGSGSTAAAL